MSRWLQCLARPLFGQERRALTYFKRRAQSSRCLRRFVRLELLTTMIPENCKLIAAHTGDGWSLEVHNEHGAIAMLAWPESWPETMTTKQLEAAGFECV